MIIIRGTSEYGVIVDDGALSDGVEHSIGDYASRNDSDGDTYLSCYCDTHSFTAYSLEEVAHWLERHGYGSTHRSHAEDRIIIEAL